MRAETWNRNASRDLYFRDVISPFADPAAKRKLIAAVKKHAGGKKTVLDLGCGLGTFLPHLSVFFHRVVGIDYSLEMAKYARRSNKHLRNVNVLHADIFKFRHAPVDLAVSVNSILGPLTTSATQMLERIRKLIVPGGAFVGVLPAMESELYVSRRVFRRELKRLQNESRAKALTTALRRRSDYNFMFGTVKVRGGRQKFYYADELRELAGAVGFKKISIAKLPFQWQLFDDKDALFTTGQKPWDWLVTARA